MSEKERSIRDSVEQIADKLGKGIDPGIKETVVALMLDDFPTSQSCEGHPDQNEGLPFPWVEVGYPYPEDPDTNPSGMEKTEQKNLIAQQRMKMMLDDYYKTNGSEDRLGISKIGIYGAFRVQTAKDESLVTSGELKSYQTEMVNFTDYVLEQARNKSN